MGAAAPYGSLRAKSRGATATMVRRPAEREGDDVLLIAGVGIQRPVFAAMEERGMALRTASPWRMMCSLARPSARLREQLGGRRACAFASSSSNFDLTPYSTGRRLSGSTRLKSHSSVPW